MDFQYVGYTGEKKLVRGKVAAPDEEKAVGQLNSMGYQVISIKASSSLGKLGKSLNFSFTPQIKVKEVIMFSRQLSILLESGIDIVTALELFRTQAGNKIFKDTIGEIIADLRGGTSFSDALAKFPKIFPTIYCRTIAAGEQSGNLDMVLKRMADYLEKSDVALKKVKSAMTYPIIVLAVAIVVVAALVFFVMPTFTKLYSSLGAHLPLMTVILLDLANWAVKYGLYVIVVIVALVVVIVVYIRTPNGKVNFDRTMLSLPVIGPIVQLNELLPLLPHDFHVDQGWFAPAGYSYYVYSKQRQ